MLDLLSLRVGLFIPATETRFLHRAHERGADAIVLDLEDGVAPRRKTEARKGLAAAASSLRERGLSVLARVNAGAEAMALDFDAVLAAGIDCVVVPKIDSVEAVAGAAERLAGAAAKRGTGASDCRMILLLETPRAVMEAAALLAASPLVAGAVFGTEDFCAELGIPSAGAALVFPAQQVALAARSRGLAAFGLPGSLQALDEGPAYEALARQARSMGFTGAFCIHPAQVAPLKRGFTPTSSELERARAIVSAADAQPGEGAYAVDGRMVDAPVVAQARRLLATARPID